MDGQTGPGGFPPGITQTPLYVLRNKKDNKQMKTANLKSEKNGVSMAVDVGLDKPIYLSPAQFEAFSQKLPELTAQYATIPQSEKDAINARAALPTDDRKKARVAAGLVACEAKLSAASNQLEKDIAEAELKLFKMRNSIS